MGQTLSEPVTNKETAICQDDFYKVSRMVNHILRSELGMSEIIALYEL